MSRMKDIATDIADILPEITAWLASVASQIEPGPACEQCDGTTGCTGCPMDSCEVRVYLTVDDGSMEWRGCWGDPSYDQDHRGSCGADSVSLTDAAADHAATAARLVEDALDAYQDDSE